VADHGDIDRFGGVGRFVMCWLVMFGGVVVLVAVAIIVVPAA